MRILIILALIAVTSSTASAKTILLKCSPITSNQPDEKLSYVDTITINTDKPLIEMSSSTNGDKWLFEDKPSKTSDTFADKLEIHEYDDGNIRAGGLRVYSSIALEWMPKKEILTYVSIFSGTVNDNKFSCVTNK